MRSKGIRFPSLGALPGGIGGYIVPGLVRLLTHITTTSDVNREQFVTWIMNEFEVRRSTAENHIPTLVRLNVVERRRDSQLLITKFGRQFLAADDTVKISIMADYLMQHYLALPEVLAVYNESESPLHLDEVVERLRPKFKQWTTEAEFASRIRWLLSLHCLEQIYGRQYEITNFGCETLQRCTLQATISTPTADQSATKLTVLSEEDSAQDVNFQLPPSLDHKTLAQMLRAAADLLEATAEASS